MSDDDLTFTNRRLIIASPEEILATFRDPDRLARWWGPSGFTNTFHTFDFHPGGEWTFTMHGPNGGDYANHCRFDRIGPEGVQLTHLGSFHVFTLVISLEPAGGETQLTWRQTFEDPAEFARLKPVLSKFNEENLDRLEAELKRAEA